MSGAPREIFDCERVRAYLDSYLEGQVPPPEARAMRLHIHACAACREKAVARDPLQLFAPLADSSQEAGFWAGFWPAVRADIHAAQMERRGFRGLFARPAVAWGAAAAIVLLAGLFVLRPWQPARRVSEPARIHAVAGDAWQHDLPDSERLGEPSLPAVEDVKSPSAKVLSMKVYGRDEGVTDVVLIVDEAIDL